MVSCMSDIDNLRHLFKQDISGCDSIDSLEQLRIGWLGRKGRITLMMQDLHSLSHEDRVARAKVLNTLRNELNDSLGALRVNLQERMLQEKLQSEKIDVTLPERPCEIGRRHPVGYVMSQIVDIFRSMGFSLREGTEVESEYYNFDALNIPEEHPARQEHDTFYMSSENHSREGYENKGRNVLRTHTSPVQIHSMINEGAPIRIISPGKVFRCDHDATHTPMFHQCEGLVVDKDLHMGHLKWVLEQFCKMFFEVDDIRLRFRSSYFPFTEPSAEVDICCSWKDGNLIICSDGDDWLEVIGCGMVHEDVLLRCGVDVSEWQGFAFGMGIDRMAMLKYAIADLRTLFMNDVRWIRNYGFHPLSTSIACST